MQTSDESPAAYFERIDDTHYRPTVHCGGAWSNTELHVSPLAGLVVHAVERELAGRARLGGAGAGLLLSRLSLDILGRLADDVCELRTETLRPGRTIELLEVMLLIGGRPVIRARAWLLAGQDTTAVAGGAGEALPEPETLPVWLLSSVWPASGYVETVEVRTVRPPRPGRSTAWITSRVELLSGESAGPLASFLALVDTANGIATRLPPTELMYPNVDLTVHLHRQPTGRWVGLDSTVVFGPSGQGVTSSVLHDRAGPVGHVQQMLTVRPA